MEGQGEWLCAHVRDVVDHPSPGITFKDLTPALARPEVLGRIVDEMAAAVRASEAGVVVGIEARGFVVGAPVALTLGVGFVPARKPHKLPGPTHSVTYDLEYGTDTLELHCDALAPGQRVAIVDDVLATGGTAAACAELVRVADAEPVTVAVVLELADLGGRARLGEVPVSALWVGRAA